MRGLNKFLKFDWEVFANVFALNSLIFTNPAISRAATPKRIILGVGDQYLTTAFCDHRITPSPSRK